MDLWKMDTPVQLQGNSGSGLRWVVHSDSSDVTLPVRPQKYAMALKLLSLTGFVYNGHVTKSFGHVVISQEAIIPTYLGRSRAVSAIKSFIIDGREIRRDYAREMEFHKVDFSNSSLMRVRVLDDNGEELDVKGTFLFELYQI